MTLSGGQRRDTRRRLLMAWSRSATRTEGRPAPERRRAAEYGADALPERHPGVATLLPTGVGGLAAWTAVIGLSLAAVLAAGLYEPALASLARVSGPRFARSIAALRDCLDPRLAASLSGWLAQLLLLASAVVAFVVRFMRRHRRDDFRGRYRAWGWLGWLLVVTACCTQVPVGRVVGVAMSEATGIVLGPSGFGWWVAIAAPLLVGVALWAVLPLHERLATGLWLAAGLLAWAGSAAVIWSGTAVPVHAGTAPAAWVAGSGLVMIAMLAAARSVIREVRGTAAGKAATAKGRPASDAPGATVPAALAEDEDRQATGWLEEATSGTDYTDGSDVDEGRETRHLSKAERKRLKRLARMNRVA